MVGKDMLYRWEHNNRGLEHKCGTCSNNLSSPRAKKTCFGLHEEVCIRYHKTLHFVGYTHKCEACHRSVELHEKRHREIGVLRNSLLQLIGETAGKYINIHEALHLTAVLKKGATSKSNTSLAKNKVIDANVAFSLATFDYNSLQKAAFQRKPASKNGINKSSSSITEYDSQITTIIQRLGISNNINKTKKYQSLLTQLRQAIYLDLVTVDNEQREIMMRMAGYWRYVNRRTYNAMVRRGALWDWATGAKLEEMDASDCDSDDDDAHERCTVSTRKRRGSGRGVLQR